MVKQFKGSKSFVLGGLVAALSLVSGCGGAKIGGPFAAEFVYAATGTGIAEFAVSSNGQLLPLTPPEVVAAPAAYNTVWVTASKDAKYAYGANKTDGNISQFTISGSGSLVAMTPPTVTAGAAPVSVEITPNSKFVYCLNQTDNTIQQYSVGLTGALTVLAPATVSVASGGASLVISPNGNFLYACSPTSNTITAYSIGVTGQLTPLSTPTYTVVSANGATISPDGTHLYCPCSTGTAQFSIGVDGSLTPLSPAIVAAAGGGNTNVAFSVSANGKHGYLATLNGASGGVSPVSQYIVGLDGTLTPLGTPFVSAGNASTSIVMEPAGNYVYVVNSLDHTISEFLASTNGLLAPLSPATVSPTGAKHITIISR
jgi:6-phosphogluconolactonase (cycloisomerase 2 family)